LYIPKLESFEEAALWARIMDEAGDHYGLARGTIKATLLIETLPAVRRSFHRATPTRRRGPSLGSRDHLGLALFSL